MARRKSVPAETQPPEISAVVPADDDFVGAPEDGPNLIGDGSTSSRLGEGDGMLSETAVEVAVETVVAVAVAVAVDATPSGTTEAAVEIEPEAAPGAGGPAEDVELAHRDAAPVPGYDTGDPDLDAQLAAMDDHPVGMEFGGPDFLAAEAEAAETAAALADPLVVVLFDAAAHAFAEFVVPVEDVMTVVRTHRPIVYGVRDPATGARELHPYGGDVTPVFEAAWAAVNGEGSMVSAAAIFDALAADPEPEPVDPEALAAAVAEECAARAKACLEAFAYQRQQLGPVVALVPHEAMMQGIRIAATAARERRQAYPACTPEAAVTAIEALPAAISDLNTLFGCYVNLARAAALGADIRDALASIDGRPGALEQP